MSLATAMDNQIEKTDQEKSLRSNKAYQLESTLKATKQQLGAGFLEIGRILKEIRDNDYYVELGYDTITEWFSSPEVSISPSWAWHFIAIYETFILKHQLPIEELSGIDYTKLQDIITVVEEHPEEVKDWVEKARTLRRIDLKRELQAFKIDTKTKEFAEEKQKQNAADAENPIILPSGSITVTDWQTAFKNLEDASVDCIITTPPIVVTKRLAEYIDNSEQVVVKDDYAQVHAFYFTLFTEMKRVLKEHGSVFIFGNLRNIFTMGDTLDYLNFTILRDIIWFKRHVEIKTDPFHLLRSHETILWARKGARHVNNIKDVEKDVWEVTKKNVLIDRFVQIGTYPKQLVFDPFVEDESVMDLVNALDRRFIGNKSS